VCEKGNCYDCFYLVQCATACNAVSERHVEGPHQCDQCPVHMPGWQSPHALAAHKSREHPTQAQTAVKIASALSRKVEQIATAQAAEAYKGHGAGVALIAKTMAKLCLQQERQQYNKTKLKKLQQRHLVRTKPMQKQEATVNCCTGIQQTSSPNAVVFTLPIPGQGLHQDEDTIYCGGCGERLDHGNSFCANCGTKSTSSVPCFAPAASPLVVSPIPTRQMPYTLLPDRCSERPSTQHLHYIPLPQGPRWERMEDSSGIPYFVDHFTRSTRWELSPMSLRAAYEQGCIPAEHGKEAPVEEIYQSPTVDEHYSGIFHVY
jgi:hypothetical protein